ncbi:DNA recombination protein RmuC [Microbacterium sp. GXF7504]
MDAVLITLVAVLALVIGAAGGWFAASGRASASRADDLAKVAAAEATARAALQQLDEARREREAQHEREAREQSVLRALAPVRESLFDMQRKVEDLERDRHNQYGALAEQLRRAQEADESLRRTTDSLASALRSSSARGVWGETQLRRIVEAAGLTRHVDFDLQSGMTTDAGAGRPDMVVRLPGGKAIAVDAKVPLDAFLEASEISDAAGGAEGARRQQLLAKHVKAVRAHVDALAKRAYWNGLESSPEFVVCFLPSESLLSTALDADPGLLEYAFGRRVALASPVNLWAVLKTVAYTWTQEAVSEQARELFTLGNQLYDRLGSMVGHVDDLRRGLERTVDSYNRFVGSLETRVLVSARKFPGIDETRLAATTTPPLVEHRPRSLSAPEFAEALDGVTKRVDAEPVGAQTSDADGVDAEPADADAVGAQASDAEASAG